MVSSSHVQISISSQRQLARNYNERGFNFYHDVLFDEAVSDYTKCISLSTCDKCDSDTQTLGAAYYNRGTVKYRMSMLRSPIY